MSRPKRRTRVALVALAGLAALALIILHTDWARTRVLRLALSRLAPDGSIAVDRLDYNLLTLRFGLDGVAMRSPDDPRPYFTARRIEIDAPWSALWRPWLQRVALVEPRLDVIVDADGSGNFTGGGTRIETALPVERLELEGLSLSWNDDRYGAAFDADRIDLTISADAAGSRLVQGGPAVVRYGEATESLRVTDGTIGWDGLAGMLRGIELRSEPLDLGVDGRIDELFADREIDLATRATLRLDALGELDPSAAGFAGRVDVEASVRGSAEAPEVVLNAAAPTVSSGRLNLRDVVAELRWQEGLSIDRFDAHTAGGTIHLDGRMGIDAPSTLRAEWRDLELEPLLAGLRGMPDPEAVATRVDGSAQLDWTGVVPELAGTSGRIDATLRAQAPEGFAGAVAVGVGRARATLDVDLGTARGAVALRMTGGADLLESSPWASRMEGTVEASAELAALAPWAPSVAEAGGRLELSARLEGAPESARVAASLRLRDGRWPGGPTIEAEGKLTAQGALVGEPDLAFAATIDRLAVGDGPPVSATARGALDGNGWRIDRLEATGPGSVATAQATGSLDLQRLSGRAEVHATSLERLLDAAPADLLPTPLPPVSGEARATAEFSGGIDALLLTGAIDASDLRIAGQGPMSLRLRVDPVGTGAGLADLVVDGHAEIEVGSIGTLLAAVPDAAEWAPLPRIEGSVSATIDFTGSADTLRVAGDLDAPGIRIEEREPLALRASFESIDRGTRISRLVIESPGNEITASGVVGPGASTVDLIAQARIGDLATLAGLDWLETVQRLDAIAAIGLDGEAGVLTLDLWELGLALPARTLASELPARIVWSPEGLEVEDLGLVSGATTLAVNGHLPHADGEGSLRAQVRGDLADLDDLTAIAWARATAGDLAAPSPRGAFAVELRLDGNLEELVPSGHATLADASLAWGEMGRVEDIALDLGVDAGGVALRSAGASWRGARLGVSGRIPLTHIPGLAGLLPSGTDGAATARVELRSASPAMLAGFVSEETLATLGGEIDAVIELDAERPEVETLQGELRLESLRLWSGNVELVQTRPTRVAIRGARVEVIDWDWMGPAETPYSLRVSGGIDVDSSDPWNSEVALRLESDLDLSALNELVPAALLTGGIRLRADVAGVAAAIEPRGTVELVGVGIAVRDPRVEATGLAGTIDLQGTRITAEAITGRANGGDVMFSASLDLAEPMAPRGLAGMTGRGIALQLAAGVRADTDIDLTLSARGEDGMTLLGTVTLLEGGYRSRSPLSADALGQLASSAPAGEPTGMLDSIRYDIRVRSGEDLVFDTSYAQLSLSLDLEVVGAGDRPGVLGQARLNEGGEIRLAGNTLVVDRGFVDFADASRIAPTLDIEASSRIRNREVTVRLLGDAFSPTLEAEASGGLSQADALSLLATGRTLEEIGGSGREILTEQAFNMVAGRVEGIVGGAGISSVRFEQAQSGDDWRSLAEPDLFPRTTDLSARLSITRSFGSAFDLIYSQGLTRSDEQSWIGVLRLPWNLGVNAGVYDDGSRAIDLHHGIQFGRPPNDPARAAVVHARVDSVSFNGTPGRPEEELAGLVRLAAGDRFDYLAWRRDVERLRQSYLDAGYFEVSIQPSRRPVGQVDAGSGRASRVRLEYEIERGPRTVLVVEGFEPDARTRRAMEQFWQDSVADSFLTEDLERAARRAMVDRGHASPVVHVAFEEDTPEERRVRVNVRPGPRFDRVRTTVTGNDTLERDDIDDRLGALDLERGAWWHATAVVDAIRELYRERGFPDAAVEVAEPVFGAGTATAQIVIREGSPRRLGRIGFAGNEVIDSASLRATLPAASAGVLTRTWLNDAAIAVNAAYLELAYNDVQITPTTAQAGTAVDVTFEIREGPQRVLAGIEIVGRHHTRRSVIERAIRMRPGDPLVLSELQAIRRRLLATETLRSASVQIRDAGPIAGGQRPGRLVVTVVEVAQFDLRYGVQVLSDTLEDERRTRPGVSAIVAHQNFLGVGARISALARYRQDEPFARFAVSFPRFFGLPIRTTLLTQRSREQTGGDGAFTIRREETRALMEQRLQLGHLRVGYSYSWEENLNQILDLPPDSPFQLPPIQIARLIPTLIWDSRDDGFAPTRGVFHSSTYEIADDSLGSELEFAKYYGQQYLFVPAGPIVLATAVRFGSGVSHDPNSEILPRSELFLAGGGTTVRGYPDDSLGRTEFFGSYFPGGNAVLILNQEARFPLWRWLQGVAFVDAGSAFESVSEIDLSSLAWSAGAGLRLATPYVTLRLDYGFRLTDIEYLDPATGRLHFGIGHIF